MATNNELDDLAARYPDLLGDAAQADRELIETVRALDALYAVETPARLGRPMSRTADRQTKALSAGTTGTTPRSTQREVNGMHMIRTAKGRRWTGIVSAAAACLVVGLLAALLIGGHGTGSGAPGVTQQGSLSINALTGCTDPSCSLAPVMQAESSILTQRLSGVPGVRSVTITPVSNTELNIKLAGVVDMNAVLPLLASGDFAILDTGGTSLALGANVAGQTCTTTCTSGQYKAAFTGSQLDSSQIAAGLDPQTGRPIVTFAFAGNARQTFAQYTARHIGQYLTIALNGVIIESAAIESEIDGSAQITGFTSVAQAQQVAAVLKSGPLPEPFQILLVQGSCPQAGPITPVATATEPPNAPTPPPTYTPWPSSTPIGAPTATLFPSPGPGHVAWLYPGVIYVCGTTIPGPIGSATPAATQPPNGAHTPTPPATPTPLSTATPLPTP